jgi:hypothetical protein
LGRKLLRIFYHARFGALSLLTNSASASTPQFEIDIDHALASTLFSYLSYTTATTTSLSTALAALRRDAGRVHRATTLFSLERKEMIGSQVKSVEIAGHSEPHVVDLARDVEFSRLGSL